MAKFEKGHKKVAGRKKGTKDKKTVIKETFGIKSIEELKEDVLENWREYLKHNNDNYKLTATKEVSKYLFPTKKEVNLGLDYFDSISKAKDNEFENFIKSFDEFEDFIKSFEKYYDKKN